MPNPTVNELLEEIENFLISQGGTYTPLEGSWPDTTQILNAVAQMFIQLWPGGGGGGGTIDAIANIGTGTGLYKALVGTTAQFKSLLESSGIVITPGTNEVAISISNEVVLNNVITSAGGTSLINNLPNNGLQLKGLAVGAGLTLTDSAGVLTLTFTTAPITNVTDAAVSGSRLVASVTGGVATLKRLNTLDNFTLNETTPGQLDLGWGGAESASSLSAITFDKSDKLVQAVNNAAQTGNITLDPTGAKLGAVVTIVNHSDGTEPTITASTGSIAVYKAGTYGGAGVRNRISIQYVGVNASAEHEFEVSINQMMP